MTGEQGSVSTKGHGNMPTRPELRPDDHNQRLRAIAHQRFDQLFDEACMQRYGRFHGRIAIEVVFENSRPLVIHRRIEGTDK